MDRQDTLDVPEVLDYYNEGMAGDCTTDHEGHCIADDHDHGHGLRADYEMPKCPVENIKSQKVSQKGSNMGDLSAEFQRVSIIGKDASGGSPMEHKKAAKLIIEAMKLRERYMALSHQGVCATASRYLRKAGVKDPRITKFDEHKEEIELEPFEVHNPDEESHPWYAKDLENNDYELQMVNGVFNVFGGLNDLMNNKTKDYKYPSLEEYLNDMKMISSLISNGPVKSMCYSRLKYLSSKFDLHRLLNEDCENNSLKSVSHRDFYNIKKVDTHIHAASCMNQKHLLNFIKKAIAENPDEICCVHQGRGMSLTQILEDINLTPYDLSVDMLDVHADSNTFHRFDKFNDKYNPIGESRLREAFMKTDNHINGRYFGEIVKEVMKDLEDSKYQKAELRLSIYGKGKDEWDRLASWAVGNDVHSPTIRWLIQVPRLYDIYRKNSLINNFGIIMVNLFKPLFEATIDPNSHPELHSFLQYVVGFDSVDDESKPERSILDGDIPPPQMWKDNENPPYAYYLYYMYANLCVLNQLRKERGLNTFTLRPHCGEAGSIQHLCSAFLTSDNISHGLMLRKSPVLQYLYYTNQVGIAMSPLSNNSLFLEYQRNPLPEYLGQGLNISLSTDDPLMFHFTREPLMEEYSIATQVWKLTNTDMCEIARNSVIMSGFDHESKRYWVGPNYQQEGVAGNDIKRTNVSNIRMSYRYETMVEELDGIFNAEKN